MRLRGIRSSQRSIRILALALNRMWISHLVTPQQYISFLALCATPDRKKLLENYEPSKHDPFVVYVAVPQFPIA